MKKNILQYTIAFVALMALVVSLMNYAGAPKIGAVDFKRLVSEYDGMKDATKEYEDKMVEWNHLNDSLSNEIKMAVEDYYADSAFLSKEEMLHQERRIIAMRNDYVEFTQGLDVNAQQEDQKMTAEVVNKVLSFVEKYGDRNGFDAIIGRNDGNYVLYKNVEIDITDELLKELNLDYAGY